MGQDTINIDIQLTWKFTASSTKTYHQT